MDKLLEIKDLHVIYKTDEDTVYAVNGVNFVINKGGTFGLVGETGAGKTTTALSIMRLLPKNIGFIEKGQIILEGNDITEASEKEMKSLRGNNISMIFQDPMTSLNPILTIGNQLSEIYEIHQKHLNKLQREEKIDEMLRLVGLSPERKSDYPHQLSGGMKQRVVIALSLALEPKLIIADEPTTALDVTIQAQVLQMMRELKEEFGTAMILITHDLGVVAENCDRVAVMYSGEIIEMGTVEDIFESKNHHPYTIGLFGSIPDLTKNTKRLEPIGGMMADPTELPDGCKFHPRCPKCMTICKTEEPKEILQGEHMIKCHLFSDKFELL